MRLGSKADLLAHRRTTTRGLLVILRGLLGGRCGGVLRLMIVVTVRRLSLKLEAGLNVVRLNARGPQIVDGKRLNFRG